MHVCCELGAARYEPRVVHESPNFFVVPTVGSMGIMGYFLVISKEHYEGMGSIPAALDRELSDVVELVQARITEKLNARSLVFEHGPKICDRRGGGCLDHAHFHVVPEARLAKPLAGALLEYMSCIGHTATLRKTSGYGDLRLCCEEGKRSYMYVKTEETFHPLELMVDVDFQTPSQFMRRLIAQQFNPHLWNWKTHPDENTMRQTLDVFGTL